LDWVFLGRKVHFTESRNFPSASQSSTANSTMNAFLFPRHTLHNDATSQPITVMIDLYERSGRSYRA